jgi:hypothetical protein
VTAKPRQYLYGEAVEDHSASRMLRDRRHKLIWYPAGNRVQLFDLQSDPSELHDLAEDSAHTAVRHRLEEQLAARLYGKDVDDGWVGGGRLTGYDPGPYRPKPERSFSAQRGLHYPPPPAGAVADSVGFPE